MTDLEAAWDAVHTAAPKGWVVAGRPTTSVGTGRVTSEAHER